MVGRVSWGLSYLKRRTEKMDDCANCEFLEKCREGEKMPCPWETVKSVYNPNI